ncbi:Hypothetical protein LOCK919_2141 [Lacticaseibacillus paracasei]|nr:Hypothetical protein LOCK919_2141 [Lacticaseibacillus paracasei]
MILLPSRRQRLSGNDRYQKLKKLSLGKTRLNRGSQAFLFAIFVF